MKSRAMIVVAGGSATRFGGEKLLADIAGRPLIAHTLEAVSQAADLVVLVARLDLVEPFREIAQSVVVTPGGNTRTDSELAGLTALGREFDLIGIHDGARPLIRPDMVEDLYRKAEEVGGAAPVLPSDSFLVEKVTLKPISDAMRIQTPQVFRGPELLAAYVKAAQTAVTAHDSVEVVHRFGDLDIAAVEGDPENIKVTFPEDVEVVRRTIESRSGSKPR